MISTLLICYIILVHVHFKGFIYFFSTVEYLYLIQAGSSGLLLQINRFPQRQKDYQLTWEGLEF